MTAAVATVGAFTLTIPGAAVGKARPRFSTRTGHAYTPTKTKVAEADVKAVWREAGCPRVPDVALDVTVVVRVDRPTSHFLKDGTLSAAGKRAPMPVRKPDSDNILKGLLDALNGLAYRDDSQVCQAHFYRRWTLPENGESAQTELTVSALYEVIS